ncbi:MAG: WD40 repeat domain-containing protein, partial [Nodosilinea sp.]
MDKSLKPSLLAIALIGAIATIPVHALRSPEEWLAQADQPATPSLTLQNRVAQGPENTDGPASASRPPGRIALSNDGQLIVRGTESGQLEWLDGQGKVWQTVSAAHQGAISAVVITPDGQTAISSGVDGTLRRWSRAGKPLGKAIPGRGGAIRALALSPDGQTLISGNQNGTIERWSVVDGTSLSPLIAADNSPIQAITYADEGKNFFTGSGDGSLARWSPEGGLLKRVDGAHQGGITSIIASPYGKVITSGGGDGVVRSWDQATLLPQVKPIPAHNGAVTAMAYSPNGTTVATAGADKTLRLWGGDGVPLSSAPLTLNSPANFLGFTPDGQVVVGTADNRLEIRDGRDNVDVNSNPATPPPPEADLWARIQALPPNTWWILLAVPVVLFLLGILGSLFRTQAKPKPGSPSLSNETANETASTETPVQPLPGADMGIDFSGIGQQPSGGEGLSLPPEAALVPVAEVAVDSTIPGKLEQARSELVEGKRLMREQRYDLALIRFNSAIEATELERLKISANGAPMAGVNVIAAQAQAQRGNALLQMEQAAEAMESYNIALGFDTSNTEAWLGKGRLLTKLERYEEALFCFDSALEMDKTAIAAWSGKAEALMQLGRQAEAQTCIARVLSLGGEPTLPLPTGTGPITAGIVPDVPIDGINVPPDRSPSVSPGYDPDIPLELQQMVESLPSAEIGSPPMTLAIPPEL